MNLFFENLALRLKPAVFDLGGGQAVKLSGLVGAGKDKLVYRIQGRDEVLKVLREHRPGGENAILQEISGEAPVRNLGIAVVPSLRHDPRGRWAIKRYVPEPTVRHLIKAGSPLIYTEHFVRALFALTSTLRDAKVMMDLTPRNWVFRGDPEPAQLLSLEPILLPALKKWGTFEETCLPLWLGSGPLFRIKAKRLATLRRSWEEDERFSCWRCYFGEAFPVLGPRWKID